MSSSSKSSPSKSPIKGFSNWSCWLKSTAVNSRYPPIELQHKEPLVIGRSRDTKIRDARVSRQQIEATLNLKEQKVQIKQVGPNNSGLNGKPIRMGLSALATAGDILEVCLPKPSSPVFAFPYSYRLTFECDSPVASTSTAITASKRTGESGAAGGPPLKIPKMFLPKGPSESADQFRKDSLLSTKGRWEAIKGDDFFVFSNDECMKEHKESVGAFDLDGTIIKTKSGRVFPKDEHDWAFRTSATVTKLQNFFGENQELKFVIFTNQNGIKKSGDVVAFKRKIELIIRQIGVPALVFVGTKKDKYRKPMTGGWDVFVSQYNGGISPATSKSFYCGDAAGRVKDHSKSDRLFALNLEIQFKTPEEFFEGSKPTSFASPLFAPKDVVAGTGTSAENSNAHIKFPHSKEMIIMVGMPASGKSFFVKSVLLPKGYAHINRDTLKTMPKCLQGTELALREGKCVVIDNTNPTKKDREAFLKLAKERGYVARCFRMKVDHMQCLHNNKFRYLSGDLQSAVPDVAFNTFKSNFQEPSINEGYEEVVAVNFVSDFSTEERANLYGKYLLEK